MAFSEDFDGEDGTSDGGSEDSAEAGGDAGHEDGSNGFGFVVEVTGECGGDAAADLEGGAFAADGGAEKVAGEGV